MMLIGWEQIFRRESRRELLKEEAYLLEGEVVGIEPESPDFPENG